MKKKIILLLVLAVIVAGGVFAESGVKNYISGEVSLLGGGARYERMLTDSWSIGGTYFWNTFFILTDSSGVMADVRFYPGAGKFFIELGLGFGWVDSWNLLSLLAVRDTLYGVMLSPGIGWRIDFGDPGGFFINPMISVPMVIGGATYYRNYRYRVDFGFGVDFRAGIGFGFAF